MNVRGFCLICDICLCGNKYIKIFRTSLSLINGILEFFETFAYEVGVCIKCECGDHEYDFYNTEDDDDSDDNYHHISVENFIDRIQNKIYFCEE